MRRFPWRPNGGSSSQDAEEQSQKSDENTINTNKNDPTDDTSSPARSSSINSGSRIPPSGGESGGRGGGESDGSSPPRRPSGGGGGVVGTPPKSGSSNKKMLKIGRNVRFRGDVMECDTVLLCGRLQGFVESRRLTIKEGGSFVGDAKVEDADVAGMMDGTLESTSRVIIRSTGTLCGNVVYNRMTMEDGAELEGTYECSTRRLAREAAQEAGPLEQAATRAAANSSTPATGGGGGSDDAVQARTTAREDRLQTPPREQSPLPWEQPKDSARGEDAMTPSPPRRPTPQRERQPLSTPTTIPPAASSAHATGAATENSSWWFGSNPKPTVDVPQPAASKSTFGSTGGGGSFSSLNRRISPGNTAHSSPVTVPGISPSKPPLQPEAVSVRSSGLPMPSQSTTEASELFSAEVETPKSVSNPFIAQGAMTPVGRSRTASNPRDKTPTAVDSSPVVAEGPKSVAAKIGMWPPPSPTHARTPITLPKRTESGTPASKPTTQTSAGETRPPAVSASPPLPQSSEADGLDVAPSASGGAGVLTAPSGGGTYEPNKADGEDGGGAKEDATLAEPVRLPEASGTTPMKACERADCSLEACWGDPRFRPRYCVTHKRQGHKLMDPVEMEEGDEAAEPERSLTPPNDRSLSSNPQPEAANVSSQEAVGDEEQTPPPFLMVSTADAVLPPPAEPIIAAGDVLHHRAEVSGTETQEGDTGPEEEDSEEDVDDDWHRGIAMLEANGIGSRTTAFPVKAFASGGGIGQQPQQSEGLTHKRSESADFNGRASGVGSSQGLGGSDADKEGEVLARVATFEKLSKKPTPTMPQSKPKTVKASKRSSGNNIADFYGGGGESESDDENTFSMDAYNKGVLMSQAAEVGTHTEDGQLRPQASQERDQQRLAHLVRVGKLGSALRGKGVSAVGKRR